MSVLEDLKSARSFLEENPNRWWGAGQPLSDQSVAFTQDDMRRHPKAVGCIAQMLPHGFGHFDPIEELSRTAIDLFGDVQLEADMWCGDGYQGYASGMPCTLREHDKKTGDGQSIVIVNNYIGMKAVKLCLDKTIERLEAVEA